MFQQEKGPFIPTLRLVHQYPTILPVITVDFGAIPYVLRGVNMAGVGIYGDIPDNLQVGDFVAIKGQEQTHACAIGRMTRSTDDIRNQPKGMCIDTLHVIGDGLWDQTK